LNSLHQARPDNFAKLCWPDSERPGAPVSEPGPLEVQTASSAVRAVVGSAAPATSALVVTRIMTCAVIGAATTACQHVA